MFEQTVSFTARNVEITTRCGSAHVVFTASYCARSQQFRATRTTAISCNVFFEGLRRCIFSPELLRRPCGICLHLVEPRSTPYENTGGVSCSFEPKHNVQSVVAFAELDILEQIH